MTDREILQAPWTIQTLNAPARACVDVIAAEPEIVAKAFERAA